MSKPAFPQNRLPLTEEDEREIKGMTMREYASLEILKGLMLRYNEEGYDEDYAISESVVLADKWKEAIEFIKEDEEHENNS